MNETRLMVIFPAHRRVDVFQEPLVFRALSGERWEFCKKFLDHWMVVDATDFPREDLQGNLERWTIQMTWRSKRTIGTDPR